MGTLKTALYTDERRRNYLASRYMEHESTAALCTRYKDLLNNILVFDKKGKASFLDMDKPTFWSVRIADFFAESDERYLGESWRWQIEEPILSAYRPKVLKALQAWGSRTVPDGGLVKYGRKEHLAAFVDKGAVRISLASTYADPSLNAAIGDDELKFKANLPPGTRLQLQMEDGAFHDIPGIRGPISNTRHCNDYYVFCTSGVFDPRAFDSFGYDACVLIKSFSEFTDIIRSKLCPGKSISAGPATYSDPLCPDEQASEVMFLKHMRYAYQAEWRIVWEDLLEPTPRAHFHFELGNLSSFCELIELQG